MGLTLLRVIHRMNRFADKEVAVTLSVSIIIPAYNEGAAIGDVVRELRQEIPDYEVVVVNDGSSDDTGDKAREAGATVIDHPVNRGYGGALTTGVRTSTADVVVVIDGDGQHDPADVARLVAEMEDHDMAVGARTDKSHVDLKRVPGKKVLKTFANFLAGEPIPDVNSGLRAFRRTLLLKYLHLMPRGFSFSTTSTFAFLKGGYRIKWIPIETRKRVGTSTVRQLTHGPQTLMLMLRLTVLFDPLRVFLPVSGGLAMMAVILTIINFIFYRPGVPATAIMMGVSAVIVFMMTLVIDQVSAIRREMHD